MENDSDENHPKKILIAESEADSAEKLRQILQKFNFTATGITRTTEETLESIAQHNPDLILLDINLPGEMEVVAAAVIIRNQYKIPLVFTISEADDDLFQRTKSAEPLGYFAKPYRELEVRAVLESAFYLDASRTEYEESQTNLKAILDNTFASYILLDRDRRIVLFNQVAFEFTKKYRQIELKVGMSAEEIEDGFEALKKFQEKFKRALRGEVVRYEQRIENREFGEKWFIITYAPIYHADKITGVSLCKEEITSRKIAENALVESEKWMRMLVENADDIIILQDLEGKYLYYNGPKEFGVVPADVIGKMPADFHSLREAKKLTNEIKRVAKTGESLSSESAMEWQGERLWFINHRYPVKDAEGKIVAVGSICRNNTDIKKAEETLRFTQFAVDHAADAALWMGKNAKLIYANNEACRRLGYTRQELLKMTIHDFDPNFPKKAWAPHWEELREKKSYTFESVHRTKSGKDIPVEITVNHVEFGGKEYNCAFSKDITDRKRAGELLRNERERLFSVLESIPAFVYLLDEDYNIRYSNREFQERFGDPEGRKCYTVFLGKKEPCESCKTIDALRLNRPIQREWTDADGSTYVLHDTPIKDTDGSPLVLEIGLDITARKKIEEALRESEGKYRTLVLGAMYGIFRFTIEGKFTAVNPALVNMLDYDSVKELMKVEIATDIFIEPRAMQKFISEYSKAKSIENLEVNWKRKDGKTIIVRLSGHSIPDKEGKTLGFEMIAEDVTQYRQLESKIQQAQKLESLGVLAGGVAHDFNNLLQGILGNASLAMADLSPYSPARECCEEIEKSALRAAELTKQLLAYSGKGRFMVHPVNLSDLCRDMKEVFKSNLSESIALRLNLSKNLPLVEADIYQMRQLLMNLVTNSVEAMTDKGGIISISTDIVYCEQIYLDRLQWGEDLAEGDYVLIEISDTGTGMNEDTVKKIFDPFFSTKFTGRGLGLAAVSGIVRGHKGAIEVQSKPEEGTRFKIMLPIAKVQENGSEIKETKEWKGAGTILFVDDDESVRRIVGKMLKKQGFEILFAKDGEEAVQIYKDNKDKIQLVLLDLKMPKMNGRSAFEEIRKFDENAVILMSSGFDELEARENLPTEGLAGFIQKPYKVEEIIKKLREILGDE